MFQSNHSHLHGNRLNAVKPPLPSSKPSTGNFKKMDSLDSSVVNKFLQVNKKLNPPPVLVF